MTIKCLSLINLPKIIYHPILWITSGQWVTNRDTEPYLKYTSHQIVDILPRLKSGDSYGAHPGINPE